MEAAHAALFGLSNIRECFKASPLIGRLSEHFSLYDAALLPPHFSLHLCILSIRIGIQYTPFRYKMIMPRDSRASDAGDAGDAGKANEAGGDT